MSTATPSLAGTCEVTVMRPAYVHPSCGAPATHHIGGRDYCEAHAAPLVSILQECNVSLICLCDRPECRTCHPPHALTEQMLHGRPSLIIDCPRGQRGAGPVRLDDHYTTPLDRCPVCAHKLDADAVHRREDVRARRIGL